MLERWWRNGLAVITLLSLSLQRLRLLSEPQLALQFQREVHRAGIASLPVLGVLAAFTGVMTVTLVSYALGRDSEIGQSILFHGLYFELAPLITVLLLVARNSATIASELATMHWHQEFVSLQRMGIRPADYLALPTIAAWAVVLPVLTISFQVLTVLSGWLAVSLLQGQPLGSVMRNFLDEASVGLAVASLIKSALMGALGSALAVQLGSSQKAGVHAVSEAGIQAVGAALVCTFAVDIFFAMGVFWLR